MLDMMLHANVQAVLCAMPHTVNLNTVLHAMLQSFKHSIVCNAAHIESKHIILHAMLHSVRHNVVCKLTCSILCNAGHSESKYTMLHTILHIHSIYAILNTVMVATGQEMVRGKKFFKVREMSGNFILGQGKLEILKKSQGK